MKEQNEVLCSVIYDSIDLFVDFKKKGYVYGKHITNDDKVAISLYLSLISNNPIINKIMNSNVGNATPFSSFILNLIPSLMFKFGWKRIKF